MAGAQRAAAPPRLAGRPRRRGGDLGLAMVVWPSTFAAIAVAGAGVLRLLTAVAELLRMAAPAERAVRRRRRAPRVVIVAAVLVLAAG
jgi:hypothetical protein